MKDEIELIDEPRRYVEDREPIIPTLQKEGKLGCFAIDWQCFEDYKAQLILFKILGSVLICRADADYASRTIDYTAYCHQFEPVEPGIEAPRYGVTVDPESGEVRWHKSEQYFGPEISLANLIPL